MYNSRAQGTVLRFWTLTRGYAIAYKGSDGLTPNFSTVPYVMNTDDKALLEKLRS